MNQLPPQPPSALASQQRVVSRSSEPPQRISIVDFDMPFGRMVVFMIKWAFAAIPAIIVIWAVIVFVFFVVAVFFGGVAALSQHH